MKQIITTHTSYWQKLDPQSMLEYMALVDLIISLHAASKAWTRCQTGRQGLGLASSRRSSCCIVVLISWACLRHVTLGFSQNF